MQRQGTDTANEKKMLQRIKLTDKEVPDDIDKHSSCLNGYIRILYIYIYTRVLGCIRGSAERLGCETLTSENYLALYLYIAIDASINHVYIHLYLYIYIGVFLIWVPENEPLKQPLKQTSETHPLKQPLKQGHSWLKKL